MDKALKDKLDQIAKEFSEKLPSEIEKLHSLWNLQSKDWNQNRLIELHRKAHTLKGATGMLGHPELSKLMTKLAVTFQYYNDNDTIPTLQEINEIDELVKELKKSMSVQKP